MILRILLLIEILVLSLPALIFLGVGIVNLPVLVFSSPKGFDSKLGLIMTIFGIWGALSLFVLAKSVFTKNKKWLGHKIQWFGISLGVCSCLIGLANFYELPFMLYMFSGPIIVFIHLLYLTKQNVF